MPNQSTFADFAVTDSTGDDGSHEWSETDELYKNKHWLHTQYVENEKTMREMADECSVSYPTVRRWMKKFGIEINSKGGNAKYDELQDEDWLQEQYVERQRLIPEIAGELDTSFSVVGRWLDKHGIETRSLSEANSGGEIQKLHNEEWLRHQYIAEGKSVPTIAELIDVSEGAVHTYLEKYNIDKRSSFKVHSDGDIGPLQDRNWLFQEYIEKERSMKDIADELGVASPTVKSWLERHHIETRSLSEALSGIGRSHTEELQDESWLREKYVENEWSQLEIADELNVNRKTVRRWLDEHGIERRSNAEARAEGNVTPLQSKSYLYEEYVGKARTIEEIAEELGVGHSTVGRWLRKHDIETRDRSERRAEGNVTPLHDEDWVEEMYIDNKRTMLEIANELDVARPTVRRHIENHGFETRSRYQVLQPDHLDHVVRSTWELRVAELLQQADINYEYEGISIEYTDESGTVRTYTPDFVTDDYIIEVKGIYIKEDRIDAKAKAMMQREERKYVVVGTQIPCDIHIPWENNEKLLHLFE